jgi:hypothetical protein
MTGQGRRCTRSTPTIILKVSNTSVKAPALECSLQEQIARPSTDRKLTICWRRTGQTIRYSIWPQAGSLSTSIQKTEVERFNFALRNVVSFHCFAVYQMPATKNMLYPYMLVSTSAAGEGNRTNAAATTNPHLACYRLSFSGPRSTQMLNPNCYALEFARSLSNVLLAQPAQRYIHCPCPMRSSRGLSLP